MSDDTVKLRNGKSFYANNGIVGINDDLQVYEGYDGHIDVHSHDRDLSVNDKMMLAERMIDLWRAYAKKAEGQL